MTLYIGIDDTDVFDSRGTGQLARLIADDLSADFAIVGIVRHQLLLDSRIPYTARNSSASILIEADVTSLDSLFERVRQLMLANFVAGSDPGLALAVDVHVDITAFGRRTQSDIVLLSEAQTLAATHDIRLVGLGGTNGGMIGALASVGLAAGGNDGRYIRVGTVRELAGLQSVATLHEAGITSIQTMNGEFVTEGLVLADKMRPARRDYHPTLFVEKAPEGHWLPLKLD